MKIKNTKAAERIRLAVAILILLALSIGMPFSSYQFVTAGLLVLCGAFLLFTARKKFAVVITFFLLFGLVSTDSGFGAAAVVLSVIVGTGLSAFLFEKTRSPLVALIPLLGFAAASAITRDPLSSVISLGYLLPSAALAVGLRKLQTRVGTVCLASASILAGIGVLAFIGIWRAAGAFSLSVLKDLAAELKSSFAEMLLSIEVPISQTETQKLFSRMDAQNLASAVVSLFPALLVIFCNVLAYLSQMVHYNLITRADASEKLDGKMYVELSPLAGAVFILSFILSAAISSSGDAAAVVTVCENIFLILIPGLALSGFTYTLRKIAERRRGGGFTIFFFIFLLFFNVASALLFAACIGAYHSIAAPLTVYLRSKKD